MTGPEHSINITRTIAAPADRIYAAWTQPDIMERRMGEKIQADVRIGGLYRSENHDGNGGMFINKGEYLVLEPDRRVKQTLLAGDDRNSPYVDEFIEITLDPAAPSQTRMTFINGWNGRAMSDTDMEATRQAWSIWLDLMEQTL